MKVGKILAIVMMLMIIPVLDVLFVPMILAFALIPGVMFPIAVSLVIIAAVHYFLIKLMVDAFNKEDKDKKQ